MFIGLARGALSLSVKLAPEASLAGWLCRSARNLSLNLRRDEFRRRSRERQAMENLDSSSDAALDWEHLRPALDEAMSELSEADYDSLVLRYFKNQDLMSVGVALGVSDDAAQKRVSRALEKLRDNLSQRGITTSAAMLSVVISANAVVAAPIGLAASISTAAALAGTTIIGTVTATKAIAMTTLQKSLIAAMLVAVVGTGIFQARQVSNLKAQNQLLLQDRGLLAESIRESGQEPDNGTRQLLALRTEVDRLKGNSDELLKLRGQVGVLRQELALAKALAAEASIQTNHFSKPWAVGEIKPKSDWQDAGLGSPLAAIETYWWAAANKDIQKMKQCIAFGIHTNAEAVSDLYARREAVAGAIELFSFGGTGLRLLAQSFDNTRPDLAKVTAAVIGHVLLPDGTVHDTAQSQEFELVRIKDDWKVLRNEHTVKLTPWDEDDWEAISKAMLDMDPKTLEQLKSNPHLPLRTLRAYEALKAKGTQ